MKQYQSLDEFEALIQRDIVREIYSDFAFTFKVKADIDELFQQSDGIIDNIVLKKYEEAKTLIPKVTSIDSKGNTIIQPAYKVPVFPYKRFDNETMHTQLLKIFEEGKAAQLRANMDLFAKNYSPSTFKWLEACGKLFYNIKPSMNSLYYLQTFALQIKSQILKENYNTAKIMLMLISQSSSGSARGGCGKTYLLDKIKSWIKENLGECYFESSSLPSTFTTGVGYSNNLFAFISDPQNHNQKDFDVSTLNNIIDKEAYTRNEKFEKNETYRSCCNLITTSNYCFPGDNKRRFGEVIYWPLNIVNILNSDSPDKDLIPTEDLDEYIYNYFFCVPNKLLCAYDPKEDAVRTANNANLISKYNILWDKDELAEQGGTELAELTKGVPCTPSKIARILNSLFPDDRKLDAAMVYEKIFCTEDGRPRWKAVKGLTNTEQYRSYEVEPILVDRFEEEEESPLLKTKRWWDNLIELNGNDPDDGSKKSVEVDMERELIEPVIDLKALHLPAFRSLYCKQPNYLNDSRNEFFCVTPYTKEAVEKMMANEELTVCRGREVMEPLGFVYESDSLPKEEQLEAINKILRSDKSDEILGVVYSGGKSYHVTAILDDEYQPEEKVIMKQFFKELWVAIGQHLGFAIDTLDPACANVGRLTRFPNGTRANTGVRQEVYHWNQEGRIKFNVHEWCKQKLREISLKPTFECDRFDRRPGDNDVPDEERLNRCKNVSEHLQNLQDAYNGCIPAGKNYYAALLAGKGIGLSRDFLLDIANAIHQAHPSNLVNPDRMIDSIFGLGTSR